MLKARKLNKKLPKMPLEQFSEEFYEDDFEEYDFDEEVFEKLDKANNELLETPSVSSTSSTLSASPETDSAGNNNNTNESHFVDCEVMSSFASEYDCDEDADCEQNNYDFSLFHEVLEEFPVAKQKRYKNGTRTSLTFSNQRVREIERDNQLLLQKIMRNGPAGDGFHNRKNQFGATSTERSTIKSASEVNRRRRQNKIDMENQILKQKLDKIARRPL